MSTDIEHALLGCIALAPDLMGDVAEHIVVSDFGDPRSQVVYESMLKLSAMGDPWDLPLLMASLEHRPAYEWGGPSWLLRLPSLAPSADAWVAYAKNVRRAAMARSVLQAAKEAIASIEEGDEPAEVLGRLETAAGGVRRLDGGRDGFIHVGDTVGPVVDGYRHRAETGELPGAKTGLSSIDAKLAGLHKGDLIILGAPPATGKTALALALARGVARHAPGTVAMFSMEMTREALVGRMLCSEGKLDAEAYRIGKLDRMSERRLIEAQERLSALPIYIDDKRGLSITELRLRSRRLAQRIGPISLLIVDYLQLAKGTAIAAKQSREREVAEISTGLKVLGQEIDAPVLALAQLSRSWSGRGKEERRPVPSDLRDSGQIEQDADVIALLYRDEIHNPDTPDKGVIEVIIAKQRNGAIGTVKLAWHPEHQDFTVLKDRYDSTPIANPRPSGGRWERGGEEGW